mmetsp:Transcript_52890/g.172098  ORF Transcript_52890/g.172098 Transcript_52890/m.172098 type:complete len:298 (+) Transcript_52890:243-1136(+)
MRSSYNAWSIHRVCHQWTPTGIKIIADVANCDMRRRLALLTRSLQVHWHSLREPLVNMIREGYRGGLPYEHSRPVEASACLRLVLVTCRSQPRQLTTAGWSHPRSGGSIGVSPPSYRENDAVLVFGLLRTQHAMWQVPRKEQVPSAIWLHSHKLVVLPDHRGTTLVGEVHDRAPIRVRADGFAVDQPPIAVCVEYLRIVGVEVVVPRPLGASHLADRGDHIGTSQQLPNEDLGGVARLLQYILGKHPVLLRQDIWWNFRLRAILDECLQAVQLFLAEKALYDQCHRSTLHIHLSRYV